MQVRTLICLGLTVLLVGSLIIEELIIQTDKREVVSLFSNQDKMD